MFVATHDSVAVVDVVAPVVPKDVVVDASAVVSVPVPIVPLGATEDEVWDLFGLHGPAWAPMRDQMAMKLNVRAFVGTILLVNKERQNRANMRMVARPGF